jgi:polyisoprenoid-binding protein YceI
MNRLLCLFLLLFPFSVNAKEYTIKKGAGNKVEWLAVGNPGLVRINGAGGWVEGKASDNGGMLSGEFSCQMDVFDTDMDMRNKHMKEKYLEVGKYPVSKFKLDPVKVSETPSPFTGDLTLKGATKKVSGKLAVKKGKALASFKIKMDEFSIGVPVWLGVTVAKDVDVTVEFPLGD